MGELCKVKSEKKNLGFMRFSGREKIFTTTFITREPDLINLLIWIGKKNEGLFQFKSRFELQQQCHQRQQWQRQLENTKQIILTIHII